MVSVKSGRVEEWTSERRLVGSCRWCYVLKLVGVKFEKIVWPGVNVKVSERRSTWQGMESGNGLAVTAPRGRHRQRCTC